MRGIISHDEVAAATNDNLSRETWPIVDALLMHIIVVVMMVRFGSLEKAPFPVLPYWWAAVFELYGLR